MAPDLANAPDAACGFIIRLRAAHVYAAGCRPVTLDAGPSWRSAPGEVRMDRVCTGPAGTGKVLRLVTPCRDGK